MAKKIGAWRKDDPDTSEEAARSVDATTIMLAILKELAPGPSLHGEELSVLLRMPTISVVPRLAPMRRDGWIFKDGKRVASSGRQQTCYVISPLGLKVLTGGIPKVLADGQIELL